MAKKAVFQAMYEDSPGGKYYRRIEGRRFHIIEWTDMIDACGKDATEHYNVSLKEIDLDTMPPQEIESGLRSCGYVLRDGIVVQEYNGEPVSHGKGDATLITMEACHSYGNGAPLYDACGNNLRTLMREARAESLACSEDSNHYEEQMSRPVNAIGSTAREYSHGDIYSAMDRGCRQGNDNARLMAKLYGVKQETIDAVKGVPAPQGVFLQVKQTAIPSTDPMAFLAGFMAALSGQGKDADTKDLAPAYLEGYRLGVAVKAGKEQMPDWAKGY